MNNFAYYEHEDVPSSIILVFINDVLLQIIFATVLKFQIKKYAPK
jgi:hypothetical protein